MRYAALHAADQEYGSDQIFKARQEPRALADSRQLQPEPLPETTDEMGAERV